MKTVLVTGGAGYIGSHIAKALAAAGIEPVVFDNLSMGHPWAVQWGPLVEADLLDSEAIARALHEHHISAVIHAAGLAYVGESGVQPRKYFHNNVTGTLNLLDAMLDAGVPHFVFSSSCTVYGIPQRVPLDESHPQAAISPYGETKLAVERILHWYAAAYPLRFMALRYFNAAGADLEGQLGEVHDPETHLIPLTIFAGQGRGPLRIFGDDYDTPDGTAIRDYVHVADLADAHVRALGYLARGGPLSALNLGTGRGSSIREVIQCVERVTGKSVPASVDPRRAGDAPALVADPSLANRELDWTPRHSALETLVESAWSWFRKA